jgi:tetratricopeptide (TPR) repeat protein
MDDFPELSELIDRIQELLDVGLPDEAFALLNQYENFYPDEWEIYFLHSRICLEKNNPSAAIPFLHKSLRIDKNNVDCLLGLFYTYSQMGRLKKSSKYLFRAERYHPDNESVLSALVWYYTEINEPYTAIAYFDKIRTSGSLMDNPEIFRNGGIAFERTGNYQEAERCFLHALRINPAFDEARDMLADHYIMTGNIDKSITLYRDYLKNSPNNIRTLSRLVFCLSQKDSFDDAISLAGEIIKLYPNSPVGYVDCAYVNLNEGNYNEALAYAEKALDVSPLDAEALRVKAIANSEKNLDEEAIRDFEQALHLEPDNPEIMRDYYHHLRAMDKIDKMEKMVRRVIKLEYPYCIEDYWFLADYYRDVGENLKAFHYLHKAYSCMPGEKDLIPPMLDILLDAGHVMFSVPFMMSYIERSGWNDAMNRFMRHRRLKGKFQQEGLRFLRFYGEKPSEFRNYLFFWYIEKYLHNSLIIIMPIVSILVCQLKGFLAGIIVMFSGISMLLVWRILRKKGVKKI